MAIDNPFQQLFVTFGKLPEAHAENVNLNARSAIRGRLSVGVEKSGQCILLKAPRAGHGKTHLLTRLQDELAGSHEFIPLHALGGSRIDASSVLDDTLRRLLRTLPAASGLTVLDLIARRLFASSLQPLVRSGEVPCQDQEGALNSLRTRPIETFDFHHTRALTAHWARDNFELLGPRLGLELSQRTGLPLRDVSFWVNAMFRFSSTPADDLDRVRVLTESVLKTSSSETIAYGKLVALLGLMASLMRVVLVADELEGFNSDEAAALRFASLVGSLRQAVYSLDVIVSINQDVWESAFLPRLTDGLADRLSEFVVELEPLDLASKIAVLDARSPGSGAKILEQIGVDTMPSFARGLIRKAAGEFEKALNTEAGIAGFLNMNPETSHLEQSPVQHDEARSSSAEALLETKGSPPESQPSGAVEKSAPTTPPVEFVTTEESPAPAQPSSSSLAAESSADEPSAAESPVDSTDLVDDLLKQFRKRYGKIR